MLTIATTSMAKDCPSKTTLKVNSSNYSGNINIELRRGNRPGSKLIEKRTISSNGSAEFHNVCKGNYFFAFGTPDSDQVSVTRNFQVTYEGRSYNNPEITVFYSRSTTDGSQKVGSSKKRDL
jgi:hypothetical protein